MASDDTVISNVHFIKVISVQAHSQGGEGTNLCTADSVKSGCTHYKSAKYQTQNMIIGSELSEETITKLIHRKKKNSHDRQKV
jgi:hypothetical protein